MPIARRPAWLVHRQRAGYIARLQALVTDPSRPWLQKFVGAAVSNADKSIGDLVRQGVGWLTAFLRSLWSGGRALVSLFSLMVVAPVVGFYLHLRLAPDDRAPSTAGCRCTSARRCASSPARSMRAIAGFVRGQTAVCLILGSFYAIALSLSGLNFGLLIGLRVRD